MPGTLERIATALEALAAGGPAIALEGVSVAPAAPAAPAVSVDQVRAALKDHAKVYGRDAAIKILADHGADSIAKLKEDKYADVLKALQSDD